MDGIAMGTTPTIKITIDNLDFVDVDTKNIKVYLYQTGSNYIVKDGDNVKRESQNVIYVTLTQEETIKLDPLRNLKVEVRWLFMDELPTGEQKAGKTNILEIPVIPTLVKEVI